MSISLMTLAWKANLESSPKFVLISLCDNANDQGECFPSVSMIARRCGMSERTVLRHIGALMKMGILSGSRRTGRSTIYHIDGRRILAAAADSGPDDGAATPDRLSPHPRQIVTPDKLSPLTNCHPTPDKLSPPPLTNCHPTPDKLSPITITEPSIEPSVNHGERRAPRSTAAPPSPVVARLPLADGTEHAISEAEIVEWGAAYPAVDVPQQLLAMRQWCIANMANRKTARGVRSFIVRWLSRTQDRAPRAAVPPQRESFAQANRRAAAERVAALAPGVADRSALAPLTTVFEGGFDVVAAGRH